MLFRSCATFTASISAVGALTYSWSSGTNPSIGQNVSASPLVTTTYTVTGTDGNGCTSTAVSTVTVNSLLVVDAGPDDTVCIGNAYTLTAAGGPAGTIYDWNNGAFSGATQNFTAGTTTSYTVVATDPNGCQGTDSIIITVPPQMTLTITAVPQTCNSTCDGQVDVAVSPTSGFFAQYLYNWQGGYTSPIVPNLCAGTYSVSIVDMAGCIATATTTVTAPTAVTAVVGTTSPASCNAICDGATSITLSGGTPPYSYSWNNGNTTPSPANLCAGTNTCNWQDANGCSGTTTVTITQPTPVTASVATVPTMCVGQTQNLTASAGGGNGGYTFTWSAGTTPNNTATVAISPTVTTSYSVTVSDANNCAPAVATVIVVVNPPLGVTTSSDVTICAGQAANMSANAIGGDGNYTYTWASGTTPTTGASVSATPTVTTTYTVTVTDGCGTTPASDPIVVTVMPIPVLGITVSQPDGCAPLCVTFTATSNPAVQTCNWIFTNGQTATGSPTSSICFNAAGTYGATINVTDANGCQSTYTNNSVVTVYPVPNADFSYSPDTITALNPIVHFTDLTTGATLNSWNWVFGNAGDSSSVLQNPVMDFLDAGTYNVWLTVTSDHGCIDSVSHTIVVEPEFVVYVPNAFSPNEDGVNDLFFPKGIGIDTESYDLWIYDRWGNLIFTTKDWFEGWNGKVQGHDEYVQQDVYVWKIRLKTWKGEKKSFVGHVTVVK